MKLESGGEGGVRQEPLPGTPSVNTRPLGLARGRASGRTEARGSSDSSADRASPRSLSQGLEGGLSTQAGLSQAPEAGRHRRPAAPGSSGPWTEAHAHGHELGGLRKHPRVHASPQSWGPSEMRQGKWKFHQERMMSVTTSRARTGTRNVCKQG